MLQDFCHVRDQGSVLPRVKKDPEMCRFYGLQCRRALDGLRHEITIRLYAWVRGSFEKAIEGFESFSIPSQFKQRFPKEETPGRVLRLAEQTLFSPLARAFRLPALQQHFSLTGYLGLWFLLLTSTPGQGRP